MSMNTVIRIQITHKEMNIGARGFLSTAGMSRRPIVTRGVGTARRA